MSPARHPQQCSRLRPALPTLSWVFLLLPDHPEPLPGAKRPHLRPAHAHLWFVGFPESRRPVRAEDLARHTTDHSWLSILTGDVLHRVPRHVGAQLAAGDVGLRAGAVHGVPPVARLPPRGKRSAEGRGPVSRPSWPPPRLCSEAEQEDMVAAPRAQPASKTGSCSVHSASTP